VIWLLRHGDAEDDVPGAGGDAERRLTEKGRRQARAAGKALNALGADLKACLASPKVRALETAELACKALDLEAELDDRLRGAASTRTTSPRAAATYCWSATSQTSPTRSPR